MMRKRLVSVTRMAQCTLSAVLLITASNAASQEKKMDGWNLQLMALNSPEHPLISRHTAESLALLIIQERYPEDIFSPGAVATADTGEHWRVEIDNVLTPSVEDRGFLTLDGRLLPNKLVFTIRKFNGEILSVL